MGETEAKRFLSFCFFILSAASVTALNCSSDFIQKSCGRTLYPDLCCSSLAPYAIAVQQCPTKLAVVAANLCLPKIKNTSSLALALSRTSSGMPCAALRDCVGLLLTAAGLMKQATTEMRKIDNTTEPRAIAWEVSNAQTWMSAAMTNEDTCLEGFEGVESGPGLAALCDRVGVVMKYTSNALALLNAIVPGV